MATKLPTVLPADFTTVLSSELSVGGTSFTLSSNVDDDGVTLNDGLVYLTVDGANSSKEHFQGIKTGAVVSSLYSVSRQGVLTSGAVRKHRIGSSASCTDYAVIKYMNDLLSGTTDLNSSDPLKYDGTAIITDNAHLATKKYVDDTAIAGSPIATNSVQGIAKLSVAAVSAIDPIVVGQNDPQFVNYFAETGSANAYVITPSPSIGAYAVGQRFSFKATNANTTTSTLNINGLGAKTINKLGGSTALSSGDIASGMIVEVEYDGTNFLMLNPVANAPSIIASFGDGSDGTVTFDGTTTILGMVPSSSIYTMTRDIYCINMTVNTGVTIKPSGYRIFGTGTLTLSGTAKIERNGNNGGNGGNGSFGVTGTGGTAGAALADGYLKGSAAGKAGASGSQSGGSGVVGSPGTAGTSSSTTVVGAGAAGGAGTGAAGGGAAGAAGSSTSSVKLINGINSVSLIDVSSGTVTAISPSAGSGSGGSGASAASVGANGGGGGGSASAGGIIAIYFATIIIGASASITANGGIGGNGGTGNDGSGGGGGGGNGGVIILFYSSLTNSGTISVTGGAGGTGGNSGATGTTGTIKQFTA
jgi:hypothetical protein